MSIPRFHRICLAIGGVLVGIIPSAVLSGQGMPPQHVRVDPVRREMIVERRLVTGEIRAVHASSVAVRESGLVSRIEVREGRQVEKGTVLARLDDSRLSIELTTVKAAGDVARATLEERHFLLEQAARDLEALKSLSERQASNPKELADAESAHKAAGARVRQAEFLLEENDRRADLLRRRIQDMVIRAPFAGAVTAKHKEVGEWVGAGEAVFDLTSVTDLEAWLAVPQGIYASVKKGEIPVTLQVEATGKTVESTDYRIVPRVDVQGRTFPLVACIPEGVASLAPGMSVTAWVPTKKRANRLTVSKNAVLTGDTGSYLFVARGGSPKQPAVATPIQVKRLFTVRDRVVVQAPGLRPGDLAIVEGNERLFPMMPVIPTPAGTGKKGKGAGEKTKKDD